MLQNTSAVTYLGGSGVDTVVFKTAGVAGDLFQGNSGGDSITLSTGTVSEKVQYAAKTDAVLTITEGEASGYDTITNFHDGEDILVFLNALGLRTGDRATAFIEKESFALTGTTAANVGSALSGLIGDGSDFFVDASGVTRAIASTSFVNRLDILIFVLLMCCHP